ncbi:radical SAM protein [Sorangium sp. So ce542]|uniref:radical SAM protein n=1 Tax=Sorangium sp. So ce542 TaxID=3133316 RepID=UPI003F5D689B
MLTLTHARAPDPVQRRTSHLEFINVPSGHQGARELETSTWSGAGTYRWSYYNHLISYTREKGILFNALNLSTALFENRHLEALEACSKEGSLEGATLDAGLLASLLFGRYLVPSSVDEHELVRDRLARGRGRSDQLTLTLAPTMGCNFNCTYCIEPERFRVRASTMTEAAQDGVVELARRHIVDGGVRRVLVSWFGGEPLLAIDVIERLSHRLIALCEQHGCRYDANITTNGFALGSKAVGALRTCDVRVLKISLDGPEHTHDRRRVLRGGRGTFQRILDNIVAASATMNVVIRVNVDASNEGDLLRLLDALEARALKNKVTVYLGIVEENEAIEGKFKAFLSRRAFAEAEHKFTVEAERRRFASTSLPTLRGNFCSADMEQGYMIGPDGELYACWADFGDPSKRVGHLLSGERTNQEYQREYTQFDPTRHPKCSPCKVMPLCLGGCSRERLYLGEPQCGVYKFNLDARIRAYVERRMNPRLVASSL